jgi:hypothetical protein
MAKLTFDVLKGENKINKITYPLYAGFLPASELVKIAEVPSYSREKSHHQIAADVFTPPIDQWQRPLSQEKVNKIKEVYNDNSKDNLMANPILLATANQNLHPPKISVNVKPKYYPGPNGALIPAESLYTVEINYEESSRRPIWILDGQHRVHGMSESVQKNENIPFVFLHQSELYPPPFLAEIFTHVTTGAEPMQPIHGEWMKYAFKLDEYKSVSHEKAMGTVINLCKETHFDRIPNPFHNKIQFNPYQPPPKWYAFDFNALEWKNLIAENYYGKSGQLEPGILAGEIVKAIKAFESLDNRKDNSSKLFSDSNPQRMLAEALTIGLLSHLSDTTLGLRSFEEWRSFFQDTRRSVEKCNWSLPFVKTIGALSSSNSNPSRKIATRCFIDFFKNPENLQNQLLTDYLSGIGATLKLTAWDITPAGKRNKNSIHPYTFSPSAGVLPINLSIQDISRGKISIESITSNLIITDVRDGTRKPPIHYKDAATKKGQDVRIFPDEQEIEVEVISYSGDTRRVVTLRLDK